MSYKFELSNVKGSLTQLYRYISETTDEKAWKSDPIISDSSMGTSIKFPHPNATSKEVQAKSESFSSIDINLPKKDDTPHLSLELSYDNKKAAARFENMLQGWNKNICDEFFDKIRKLDNFSFKMQVKTTYVKKSSGQKVEDIFTAPSNSVNFADVVQNFKKVVELCGSTVMVEDEKAVKNRIPRISICREFSLDDLAKDNLLICDAIKTLHELMLHEPKILSEKDLKKSAKTKKKSGDSEKFYTILSNRADQQFYCRLTSAEFQRKPEHYGVQVWNMESLEEKKYIRAALKLVREM